MTEREEFINWEEEDRPLPQTLHGIEIYKDKFQVFHYEKLNIVDTEDNYKEIIKKANEESITYYFKDIKSIKYRSHFGKGVLKIAFIDSKMKTAKEVFVYGGKHGTTNMGSVVLSLDVNRLRIALRTFQQENKE